MTGRTLGASTPLLNQAFVDRLRRLTWSLDRLRGGEGDRGRAAHRPGGGRVFEGHRAYTPGDDPRHVDWNVVGRLDQIVVKVFGREEERAVDLLLDTTRSMDCGHPSKRTAAIELSAALAFLALSNGHRLRWVGLGEGRARFHGPFTGLESLGAAFEALGSSPIAADGAGAALHDYLGRVRRPGAVALVSDGLETGALEEAAVHLGRAAGDASFFHVLSPEELCPRWRGAVALTDAEGGATRVLEIGPVLRRRYARALETFRNGWRERVVRHGMRYQSVSSDGRLEDVVTAWARTGDAA